MAFGLYKYTAICLYMDALIYETAYIGPEKSKSQLRISEKKFESKKNALSDKALKGFFRKASHQGKLFSNLLKFFCQI
jgi:hypothetical protein